MEVWGDFVDKTIDLLGHKIVTARLRIIPKSDGPKLAGWMPKEQTNTSDRIDNLVAASTNQNDDDCILAAGRQTLSPNGADLAVENPTAKNIKTKKKKKKEPLPPFIPCTVSNWLIREGCHQYIELLGDDADHNRTCYPGTIAMAINQFTKNRSTISYDEARKRASSCNRDGYRDKNNLSQVNVLLKQYNYFMG